MSVFAGGRFEAAIFCVFALAGCARPEPSPGETLAHVRAITACNASMYAKLAGAELHESAASPAQTPGPQPTYDARGLRRCYAQAVAATPTVDPRTASSKAIGIGRACEKLVDPSSDDAMLAYETCVADGFQTVPESKP